MSDDKKAALIAEGMTEAEANYMVSGGRNADGLTVPENKEPEPIKADDPAAPLSQPQQPAAQTPEPDDDEQEPPKESAFYAQWHREKKRRQSLQQELKTRDERLSQQGSELSSLQEKWARIDERFRVFREAIEPPPNQPKPKPDRETDPIGYMAWLEDRFESLAPKVDQVTSQIQERDTATALQSAYVTDAQTFARATPDFLHAYNALMSSRDAELRAAGYNDPAERSRIIASDERDIVSRALQAKQANPNGPGPAQIIYSLAKARGYATPAPVAAPSLQPAADTVTKQVEAIQRGQVASRSLSSGGGAPAQQGIDLARLAAMDDAEYLDWARKLTPTQRKEYNAMIGAK